MSTSKGGNAVVPPVTPTCVKMWAGAVNWRAEAGPNHKDACQNQHLVAMPTPRRPTAEKPNWKVSRDLRLRTWTIN